MDVFAVMAFTFATTGFVIGIIRFTLATQANAKMATVEARLNELDEVAKS